MYPNQLKIIPNPPKELYLEGNIELLNKQAIAIVGSRNCSENGKMLAMKFANELSRQGLVIVSGMAKGIDTASHKGCLVANGKTIAILGNGFNHIFPKENIELYKEIINKGGLIISEYSPEMKASSSHFLERNRIVSGISIGVLVIEAAYRSGTSVTAKHAIKQGRKVLVLPHEIGDVHGVGTNNLIRKGGRLITSTKEIMEEFEFLNYKEIEEFDIKKYQEELRLLNYHEELKLVNCQEEKENYLNNKNEGENGKRDFKDYKETKTIPFKDQNYKEIYELIGKGVNRTNEISRALGKTINEVSNILFMLEIEGFIKKVAGGYICI